MRASVLFLFLVGCASNPIVVQPQVDCPEKPPLPIVYADELDPLPDDVYERVIDRDQGWEDYSERLLLLCRNLTDDDGSLQ